MRCISPVLVRSNGRRDFVPCGKCNFCLQVKRSDWTFRLLQEYKICTSADFLTFTYEDENLPRNSESNLPELSKRDLQLFKKRLRKEQHAIDPGVRLRYYSVGEYGTNTLRPHYHSIMFNLDPSLIPRLQEIWGKGLIHRGDVTEASIHYVTKYVINRTVDYSGRSAPFAAMSKGLGLAVITCTPIVGGTGQDLGTIHKLTA